MRPHSVQQPGRSHITLPTGSLLNVDTSVFQTRSGEVLKIPVTCKHQSIGAGTGPAGPAMAGPFSAEVET